MQLTLDGAAAIEQVADILDGLGMRNLKPHPAGSWRQFLEFFGDDLPSVRQCPLCETGRLLQRVGKFGPFWGCSEYPACTHTESIEVTENE